MRIAVMAAGAALASCSLFPGGPQGPAALPKGTGVGIWSVRPSTEVSQCLAQSNLGSDYAVSDVSAKQTVYRTLVIPSEPRFGEERSAKVQHCL